MSEELISSLYPPPPPYYKYFTEENVVKFNECKLKNEEITGELKLQEPPVVPTGNQYRGYGSVWALTNTLPSLEELGWRQLYSDEDETITSKDRIDELHKLLDSLLLNFLELIGLVAVQPGRFQAKVDDLKLILINMNHLLNTYRPHQTRESLIMLLKQQIDEKRGEIEEIEKVTTEVKAKIRQLVEKEELTSLLKPKKEEPMEVDEKDGKVEVLRKLLEKESLFR